MPSRERNTRVRTRLATAFHDQPGYFGRQLIDRPTQNRDGHHRCSAHCVDVRNGIGRRNAAKSQRIIDDGHKEIGGADHCRTIAQIVHCGIVTLMISDQKVWEVRPFLRLPQNSIENGGRYFTAAASTVRVFG